MEIEHWLDDGETLSQVAVADLPFEVLPYLAPSRYCESDRMMEFAMREFGSMRQGYPRVYAIREWVRNHVRFLSRSTNEGTSAIDTLMERTGVCRDFAHLMIAICRALSIQARISSSLDYGADPAMGPPDFHAVLEVYLSNGWYLLDPSGCPFRPDCCASAPAGMPPMFPLPRYSARSGRSGPTSKSRL
ncbi:Transglutaminase-like enzyme, putative cysteine protease [Cupriavidus sp. U2]|uniref:transglutaminase-like domain-containing protein n=1 Tax=Cupriavidus sp. U2 TaxID=2920269 RepID=UPI0020BF06DA|nr:transglutaminase family protein [Cupriavidus sp. U2]KAI3591761.1 Transglutaminase-like enzyme, putative cysteine protease [Cupriavidus sp. U2]